MQTVITDEQLMEFGHHQRPSDDDLSLDNITNNLEFLLILPFFFFFSKQEKKKEEKREREFH